MSDIKIRTNGGYAVIFTSREKVDSEDADYQEMTEKMERLAQKQPGYLTMDSSRNKDGFGITVSYWKSLESIQQWRDNLEHQAAMSCGRSKWYSNYSVRVTKVEREYFWSSSDD